LNEANPVETPAVEADSPQPVLVVPGHLFFVERIDLPAGLESPEIDDFAELSLENLAPFPVEQLYWGYLHSKSAGSILLYASFKERLKAQGFEAIESYLWVLPDFATLFGAVFPAATIVQLEHTGCSSRISYAAGDSLPQQVVSTPPGQSPDAETPVLRLQPGPVDVSEQGLPTFHFTSIDASAAQPAAAGLDQIAPGESALWRADIRSAGFKQAERSARRLTARISKATFYAVLFAVFLLLLEGLIYAGDLWLETKSAKIAAQAPEVRRIEDKQSLMEKLDQVAQNELRPIRILEALNQVRPEGIYFTSTVTEGSNRISIDGISNTITELNNYTDALVASGNFVMPENPRTLTRGGQTTFTATLDYTHSESAARSGSTDSTPADTVEEEAAE